MPINNMNDVYEQIVQLEKYHQIGFLNEVITREDEIKATYGEDVLKRGLGIAGRDEQLRAQIGNMDGAEALKIRDEIAVDSNLKQQLYQKRYNIDSTIDDKMGKYALVYADMLTDYIQGTNSFELIGEVAKMQTREGNKQQGEQR